MTDTDEPLPPDDPAEELLLLRARTEFARAWSRIVLTFFAGLCLLVLALVPLARVIVGKHTEFALSVGLSASLALIPAALLAGIAAAAGRQPLRRIERETRSAELRAAEWLINNTETSLRKGDEAQ
jgi:membrane protein implicated in regulation of membrane protease activity